MAFIRWRKNSAEILASMWKDGKSTQILVGSLLPGQRDITDGMKDRVSKDLPNLIVDWDRLQADLHAGPHGREYKEVATKLVNWADEMPADDARLLRAAADLLLLRITSART